MNTIKKIFNIRILNRALYTITVILFFLFIYLLFIEIKGFDFTYHFEYRSEWLETVRKLFDSLSRPFAIGAASVAFLTLALTTSRTIRLDKQLENSKKQIELIEKQLYASYQPELFLINTQIQVSTHAYYEDDGKFIFHQGFMNVKPVLPIYNIGRAVAKSVEYAFSFDYRQGMKEIAEQDVMKYVQVNSNDKMLLITYNQERIQLKQSTHLLDEQFMKKTESFILDNSQKKEPFLIPIPTVYLELYFILWLILIQKNEIKKVRDNHYEPNSILNFPKLFFYLKYQDLGNKVHLKNYSLPIIFTEFKMPIINPSVSDGTNFFILSPTEIDTMSDEPTSRKQSL